MENYKWSRINQLWRLKKKRAHKFYNHQGENDLDTLHIKVLTFRETLERSSLSQLVLGLETVKPTGINQIIRKLCDALESANQKPPQQTGMLMLSDRLLDHCDWSITKEILDYIETRRAQPRRGERPPQAGLAPQRRKTVHPLHTPGGGNWAALFNHLPTVPRHQTKTAHRL